MFSGESAWWSVIFVNHQANGQWSLSFCPPQQILFFSCAFSDFLGSFIWKHLWESAYGKIWLGDKNLKSFAIFFISEHNSLIKTFSQRSIIWLYTIIISLYHFYFATFCIWSLYFVYEKKKQPTDSCFCCTCR